MCRSINSSNSGWHLLYAILWLDRPLFKNVLDSPSKYLANAAIGASLAFQIREEYMSFSFLFLSFRISRNMPKLHVKFCNNNIYPLWGPRLKNIFFSNIYSSLIWNARLVPKVALARYWVGESRIFLIRGLASHNTA